MHDRKPLWLHNRRGGLTCMLRWCADHTRNKDTINFGGHAAFCFGPVHYEMQLSNVRADKTRSHEEYVPTNLDSSPTIQRSPRPCRWPVQTLRSCITKRPNPQTGCMDLQKQKAVSLWNHCAPSCNLKHLKHTSLCRNLGQIHLRHRQLRIAAVSGTFLVFCRQSSGTTSQF